MAKGAPVDKATLDTLPWDVQKEWYERELFALRHTLAHIKKLLTLSPELETECRQQVGREVFDRLYHGNAQ